MILSEFVLGMNELVDLVTSHVDLLDKGKMFNMNDCFLFGDLIFLCR